MGTITYILQSLWHYRYAYLGVFLGSVLGAMVLLGALFAGNSVDESLRQIGEKRIGKTTHLITGGDRFFREALAEDLSRHSGLVAAPVLFAKGVASANQSVANQVQLIGVTDAFWEFAPGPVSLNLDTHKAEVAVNELLAKRLGLGNGDVLIVRFQKPGVVAGNAPVAGADNSLESFRCTIKTTLDDDSFGRFSLETTQIPQPSVFMPITLLQKQFEYADRANLLLLQSENKGDDLQNALGKVVTLADYQLSLEWLEKAQSWEVKSDRVFIDSDIGEAIAAGIQDNQPVNSYLVNDIRLGDRFTPYSIGAAVNPAYVSFLPDDLKRDEVVLNTWIAEDLQANEGQSIQITYYQSDPRGLLLEESSTFKVRAIVPMEGLAADSAWMPDFPGISEAEVPSDWDAGLPLDLERIREKDEEYWEEYRGSPKIFISLDAGTAIWSTRWGNHTAIRIPGRPEDGPRLEKSILALLSPRMNQLVVRDFRSRTQSAASSAVDFGGLFIGMSFFLILAALGLVAMLFQFCLLQRNRESALLGSVGVKPKQLMRWRLGEGIVILLLGCLAGLPLALWYTRRILQFLESIWAGQTNASTFVFYADSSTLIVGVVSFQVLSLAALWFSIRKQAKQSLSIRLKSTGEEIISVSAKPWKSWILAVAGILVGVVSVVTSGLLMPAQGAFYLAGFSFLIAGLAICRIWLLRPPVPSRTREMDASYLGRLNVSARVSRSLTVVGLIASAVFMVLSVASFRKQVGGDWRERSSGTGGFEVLVDTTSPLNIPRDGVSKGFDIFDTSRDRIESVVPMRRGAGDNVNCFNLNTSAQPQLVGVDVERLAQLGAFSPKKMDPEATGGGWRNLQSKTSAGAIPALVDETTLMWALKEKVGAVFSYQNEKGQTFDVQIAGVLKDSIFQGYLLIDEAFLLTAFPSHPGYSLFLVDAKEEVEITALRNQIEKASTDRGGKVEITRDILTAFHEIENTYIAIFNVLGTLGVVLGSLGLTIVIARSIQERLGEFSVMTAIGISRSRLGKMVLSEYSRLIGWGLIVGMLASVISIWPNLQTLPALPTLILVSGLLLGIVLLNFICGILAFRAGFPKTGVGLQWVER